MTHFDESSKWIGWSKNEFSHRLSLQPTPMNRERARDGAGRLPRKLSGLPLPVAIDL